MPTIGGVFVPDDLMPKLQAPVAARPGLGDVLSAAAHGAYGQLRYGLPYTIKKLTDNLAPGDEAFYQQGLAEANAAGDKAPAASVSDVTSGKVGIGRFAAENLVASLPYMAGSVAGGIGGFAVGGPPGAVAGAFAGDIPQFVAGNTARAVQETGGLSQAAAERGLAVAPVQAASDVFAERFLPGAGKLFGDFAAEQSGGFLRRVAVSSLKSAGVESVTEASQQLAERYAAGIPTTNADAAGEYVNAAAAAFAVGGILGAGGGFRHTEATIKSPELVTADDLTKHIDAVLSGSTRATTPSEQLGLPLEGGQAVEQQPGLPLASPAQVEPLPASQLPQLPLNPPLSGVAPGTQLGLGQRFADNLTPVQLPTEGGAQVSPELEAALQQITPAPLAPRFGSDTSAGAIARATGAPVGPVELATPPNFRTYRDAPIDQLDRIVADAKAPPEQIAEAQREIATRHGEASGLAPLTAANFQERLDEAKRGLRGGFVQSIEASSPEDLVRKVSTEVFDNQNTQKNVQKFAQRLGILDENLEPGPAVVKVETPATAAMGAAAAAPGAGGLGTEATAPPAAPTLETPAGSAPAGGDFEKEWKGILKDAGVERLRTKDIAETPPDLPAARAMVFRALATDTSNAQLSQTEKVARKLGLVTNDDAMDVTPLGRQTFLATPEGTQAVVAAAQDQGHTGTQATMFDRGVQTQVNGVAETTTFTNFQDMAAYEAGKVWAQDFVQNGDVKTATQTAAIQARVAARPAGVEIPAERRRTLTPEQINQQSLNRLLGAVDLKGVNDTDVAGLYRMVREGATSAEVGQALQQVQAGKTLFEQPPAQPYTAPIAGRTRGQPLFKEMNTPEVGPGRAAQQAETNKAVQARYNALKGEIDGAFRSGDITAKERLALVSRLVRNDFTGVADRLPGGPLRNQLNVSARPMLSNIASTMSKTLGNDRAKVVSLEQTPATKQLQAYIKSGNILAVLRHISEHSADAGYRELARKLLNNDTWQNVTLETGEFYGGRLGEAGPVNGGYRISLFGDQGQTEETVLHELIHAYVDRRWLGVAENVLGDGKVNEELSKFFDIWDSIGNAIAKSDPDVFDRENWAGHFYNDPNEALAWMLTNKQAQAYLKSVDETGAPVGAERKSLWQRFVGWIADVLGIGSRGPAISALGKLLDAGHAIVDSGKDVRTDAYAKAYLDEAPQGQLREQSISAANRTVQDANEATKNLADMVGKVTSNLNLADFGVKARRAGLGWLSHNQLDRQYARHMPEVVKHSDAHRERVAVRGRFEQMGDEAYQSFEKLERDNPKAAEWVGQLMRMTTEFQIDPDKAWADHTHLANDKNAANLQRLHREAVDLANKMQRGDGRAMRVFNDFRASNEAQNYARMAADLHKLVAMDPELSLGVDDAEINPADQFLRVEGLTDATAIRDWWHDKLQQQIASSVAFVNQKKGEAAVGTASDQRAMSQHLSPIELQISAVHEALAAMSKAPYFHLGRFGDNFGAAVIRKLQDGTVDPAAQQHVADALEKAGFKNVQISTDNTKPRIYMRFDTVDETRRFRELALGLQQQGWLDADEIKAGPRSQEGNFGVADGLPGYVQAYIQNLEASSAFKPDENMSDQDRAALEQRKQEAVRLAIDTWLEQQPNSAISKVLTTRYTVPGFDKDMIRNFAHRWRVGSISLANVAAQPKFNRAFTDMRARVNDALVAKEGGADPYLLSDIMNELKRRDARSPIRETADAFDKLRAIGHAYFLGFSPAYGLVNMTQLGVTGLPELAKKHGYANSFHAMRRASAQTFKILGAVASEAKALGPEHWADVAVTESVLRKVPGLDDPTRNFLLHMIATGTIDIGSAARALGQIASNRAGSKLDTGLKYASSVGLYTETFSRLTMALAARELHGDNEGTVEYARKTVSESMFDYQNWNTARQLGKQGFAGPITPLLTQFMSYTVQVTEKLYSEMLNAAGRQREGETAADAKQRRAEARTFLYGHLTAVTALAGTLGMPFASVFATVLERLVDAFDDDDQPYDATASWRNFLASVLGKDAAEVVSRGLPRAAGFDLSQRVGEADLLPFSQFIGDRRSWRESIQGMLGRSVGASPNMLLNVADGGEQFAQGNIVAGLKSILPVALKGPTEVFRMTQDGYVDTKGNKLPLSPTASSYLWQLIGFTPAQKAEYSEARSDQAMRRIAISGQAAELRTGIVRAMLKGDQDTARELIAQATEFDKNNPSFAVVPGLAGALTGQVMARAQAAALGTPTGVALQDIAGQRLTKYANVHYAR